MIANYHTHTYRCGHSGNYADEEFVLHAIDAGLKVLGFSDHTPWPYAGCPNGCDGTAVLLSLNPDAEREV